MKKNKMVLVLIFTLLFVLATTSFASNTWEAFTVIYTVAGRVSPARDSGLFTEDSVFAYTYSAQQDVDPRPVEISVRAGMTYSLGGTFYSAYSPTYSKVYDPNDEFSDYVSAAVGAQTRNAVTGYGYHTGSYAGKTLSGTTSESF